MKEIVFRPLRKLKNGKIAVASYSQWRKIKVADRSKFRLVIRTDYRDFPLSAQVHNHEGEPLLWQNYNPAEIPLREMSDGRIWKTASGGYCAPGLDCDGVPAFSHGTIDIIVLDHTRDVTVYSPLTVKMVTLWLGWFIYQLENTELVFS